MSVRHLAIAGAAVALLVACSSAEDLESTGDLDASVPDAPASSDAAQLDDASAVADASPDAPVVADAGQEFSGEATYYAADGTGACGFKASPNDLMVAALNGTQFTKKAWCGKCALVTGPNGNAVKVRIVDLCPGCKNGGLDLSKQAFLALSPLSAGRIKITWHVVAC